jgi:hypothetical protein
MDGYQVGKGFSSFQVSEALVGKVCEAIQKGEAEARRYGQVRSFEIYYDGARTRLKFGRIYLVPAKIADTPEQFPAALLYGAIVRHIDPDNIADLYSARIGGGEWDEYDAKDMQVIKDRLFKDADDAYRTLVVFAPNWANARDYVVFHYTREDEALALLVRHQIYAAYFDPALSSAFDSMMNSADSLNVEEINPKLNFPLLAEGGEKDYPVLDSEEQGAGSKVASAKKAVILLAKENIPAISEEFLEPGERAVIDSLARELKAKVNGEIKDPVDAAEKQAAKTGKRACNPDGTHKPDCPHYHSKEAAAVMRAFDSVVAAVRLLTKYQWHDHDGTNPSALLAQALEILQGIEASGELAGNPAQAAHLEEALHNLETVVQYPSESDDPMDDEELAHAFVALDDLRASLEPKVTMRTQAAKKGSITTKTSRIDWQIVPVGGGKVDWKVLDSTRLSGDVVLAQGTSPEHEARAQIKAVIEQKGKGPGRAPVPRLAAKKVVAPVEPRVLVAKEGSKLVLDAGRLIAIAASGYREQIKFQSKKARWNQPFKFTGAFRTNVEVCLRNPRYASLLKQADVPLTFVDIWEELTEELGPAPVSPTPESDGEGATNHPPAPTGLVKEKRKPSSGGSETRTKDEKLSESEYEAGTNTKKSTTKSSQSKGAAWKPEPKYLLLDALDSTQKILTQLISGKHESRIQGELYSASAPFRQHFKADYVETHFGDKALKVFVTVQNLMDTLQKRVFSLSPASVEKIKQVSAEIGTLIQLVQETPDRDNSQETKQSSVKATAQKCQYCGKPAEGHLCEDCEGDLFCSVCGDKLGDTSWSEVSPDRFVHESCQKRAKEAAFSPFLPGQVLKEFYPDLQQDLVDSPSQSFNSGFVSSESLPQTGSSVSTSAAPAMGIGMSGKPEILEGAPLKQKNDIRGYMFDQEFYADGNGGVSAKAFTAAYREHDPGRDPKKYAAAYAISRISKKASKEEMKAQFADFLKRAMGEVAASFMAAFKVTSKPPMNGVPGVGTLLLTTTEQMALGGLSVGTEVGGRVKFLVEKLNDSDIKEAMNAAWSQASVWNNSPEGGFNYEVFVRPDAFDKDSLTITYSFIVGTKGV